MEGPATGTVEVTRSSGKGAASTTWYFISIVKLMLLMAVSEFCYERMFPPSAASFQGY
jgi:hypothetical protein